MPQLIRLVNITSLIIQGRSAETAVSVYGTMRKSTSMGAIMKTAAASDRKCSLPLTVLTSKRGKIETSKAVSKFKIRK